MAGVSVETSMFWSCSNHCGVLASAWHHPLGEEVSDADGRIEVPDGDFEHAFRFDDGPYRPVHPDALDTLPPRVVTRLTEADTTVVFHRFEPRQLEVWITRNGEPARDVQLVFCLARCPCGACCGTLAPVVRGVAHPGRDRPFYPEDTHEVLVYDASGGTILRRGDPREWSEREVVEIELEPQPATSRP